MNEIKKIRPQLLTMVFSGVDDSDIKAEAVRLGVVAYVHKGESIVLAQLESAIKEALKT